MATIVTVQTLKVEICNKRQTHLSLNQFSTWTCCQPCWMSTIIRNNKCSHDVTSCLAAWSHVLSRKSLSLGGGGLCRNGVGLCQEGLCQEGFCQVGPCLGVLSGEGDLCQERPPAWWTSGRYASYWNAVLFNFCIVLQRLSKACHPCNTSGHPNNKLVNQKQPRFEYKWV